MVFRCAEPTIGVCGSEREYIENAIKAGFCELGFADHAPMPFDDGYISGIRMSLGETEDYVNTLLNLRREYEKDIKIFIGFEAEYYPAVFDRFIDFIGQYGRINILTILRVFICEQDIHFCLCMSSLISLSNVL